LSVRGATHSAVCTTGAGNALRSSLPVLLTGSRSSCTNTAGTM
jgi:hypothetical protein